MLNAEEAEAIEIEIEVEVPNQEEAEAAEIEVEMPNPEEAEATEIEAEVLNPEEVEAAEIEAEMPNPGEAEAEMPNPGEALVQAREQVVQSIEVLNEANKRQEERITNLINRTLQFMNFYFVFQGVIFSSIMSSSTKIKCELKWIPCALSFLVFIFNFVAINRSISMLLAYYEELDNNRAQLDHERSVLDNINRGNVQQEAADRPPAQQDENKTLRRFYAIYCPTVLLLLVFTGVMLYSCFQIECPH
ncbi:hypothetical protein BT93_E1202 [Corymbia citriodora subsp. variegata]|nr:hypothetical protein BT93_E1202 [Corymbia citriodora subsp. variegata]